MTTTTTTTTMTTTMTTTTTTTTTTTMTKMKMKMKMRMRTTTKVVKNKLMLFYAVLVRRKTALVLATPTITTKMTRARGQQCKCTGARRRGDGGAKRRCGNDVVRKRLG
jgi:hypothetical protein